MYTYLCILCPHSSVKEEIVNLNNLNTVLLSVSYEYSMQHSSRAHKSTAAITMVNDKLLLVIMGKILLKLNAN